MYEELYEKLPDANRYWDKLGLSRPEAPLSKDDLDRIIFAHQSRIPFENLDVCDFHRPIKLGIPDLFEKIIVGNRGGYCFELNALLDALLQDAGRQDHGLPWAQPEGSRLRLPYTASRHHRHVGR